MTAPISQDHYLFTIADVHVYEDEKGKIYYTAPAEIDGDGSGGNPEHDPCFQSDTTLHDPDGKALNSREVAFIVVPPQIRRFGKGVIMGCRAIITNMANRLTALAVVGDVGPRTKIGELSIYAAHLLDIPSSPISGGESRKIIRYEIMPDQQVTLKGVTYNLMPA